MRGGGGGVTSMGNQPEQSLRSWLQGIVGSKSSEKPRKTLLECRLQCKEKKEILEKQLKPDWCT